MNNSINLISTKNEQLERELRMLLLVRVIAVSMLITLAVVSIIAFIVSTQIPLSRIKQEQNNTLASISSLHSKLTSYYLIKDRINNVNNLLATRKDYSEVMDLILSKMGADMKIQAIDIEKTQVRIRASGPSLITINKSIDDTLTLANNSKLISRVELTSLILDVKQGQYLVTITTYLK